MAHLITWDYTPCLNPSVTCFVAVKMLPSFIEFSNRRFIQYPQTVIGYKGRAITKNLAANSSEKVLAQSFRPQKFSVNQDNRLVSMALSFRVYHKQLYYTANIPCEIYPFLCLGIATNLIMDSWPNKTVKTNITISN